MGSVCPCFGAPLPKNKGPSGTPLPPRKVRTVQKEELCTDAGARVVVVGDPHGCCSELKTLLKEVSFEKGRDTLVLVGDLVNKGPESGGVIKLAREYGALCVRGNHDDDLLMAWYKVGDYAGGGGTTSIHAKSQCDQADIEWLQSVPMVLSFPWLKMIVVHAGLCPGVPLEKQDFHLLMEMRDCIKDKAGNWVALKAAKEGSIPWVEAWAGPEHVIFGHDAPRRLQQGKFATGLDTACCFGDHMTALVIDANDFSKRELVNTKAEQEWAHPKEAHK